jgi:ABC-2 type transport system ATP-binding protein
VSSFCGSSRAVRPERRRRRASGRELLALFDLEEWRDELVESYSHGMRQKLIISSAFVHKPR